MSAVIQARTWALSDGACEALKWLALVSMVLDHVNTVLFNRQLPELYEAGRLAMPIFAMVLGYNLARPGVDVRRVFLRLCLWGVACQPIVIATINRGDVLPLNILLTFAAGAACVMGLQQRRPALAVAMLVVPALVVDYAFVGVGLVAASWLAFVGGDRARMLPLMAALVGLCLFNGNAWALVGAGAVFAAGFLPGVSVPRLRWAFWAAYPAHLIVLAGWKVLA